MKTLNAAGRFWFTYLGLLLAGLVYSVHSHAGYFARVTAYTPTMNYTLFAVGAESGCYLTPSMAVSALSGAGYYWRLTAIDSSGTWSAVGETGGGGSASGIFGLCTAQPAVTSFPPMLGGVVDPAISGDSVLSGSGGSSGGSADMEAYFGYNAELFEIAVGASLLVFAIGVGVGLIINTIRRARTL